MYNLSSVLYSPPSFLQLYFFSPPEPKPANQGVPAVPNADKGPLPSPEKPKGDDEPKAPAEDKGDTDDKEKPPPEPKQGDDTAGAKDTKVAAKVDRSSPVQSNSSVKDLPVKTPGGKEVVDKAKEVREVKAKATSAPAPPPAATAAVATEDKAEKTDKKTS